MEDERQMLLRIIEGQNALLQIQAEQIKVLTENKAKGFRLLPNRKRCPGLYADNELCQYSQKTRNTVL